MDNPTNNRLEDVFAGAAELPTGDRAAWLDVECVGQPELRAEVEELLRSHEASGIVPNAAIAGMSDIEEQFARLKPEASGDRIDNFKLIEQIGEGGFGTVWLAEQERRVKREVALKIIKLGMDTKEVIARFEQERQALAMMDHPNIAKVFDAGATQTGRPFFVMELVRGVKITHYCDQEKLTAAERIALFIGVCHAVQHAHEKGIIHRDLKPSNILVTLHDRLPVPKVIDFGVAKATQSQRLTDLTIYTQFEQMIGTPLYMSPEQSEGSGQEIDGRTDVYSLGVILYELLVGQTPIGSKELLQHGVEDVHRAIRETEPKTPSLSLHSMEEQTQVEVARKRRTDPTRLGKELRGDLDWIVMKALEKDRHQRYATADALAADLQRYLADEPVLARRPSYASRARRFAKRRRAILASGMVAVFSGSAVMLGTSWWRSFQGCEVALVTEGTTAQVWRDGMQLGQTPFRERLRGRPGVSYVLRADGYADLVCPVAMENGTSVSINTRMLGLQPEREWDEVKDIRGVVKMGREGVFFAARVGDRIDAGDKVKVEAKSSVVIGNGRTTFRCGENSTVHFPTRAETGRPAEIELQSGAIQFESRNGGDFKVKTAAMSAVISG